VAPPTPVDPPTSALPAAQPAESAVESDDAPARSREVQGETEVNTSDRPQPEDNPHEVPGHGQAVEHADVDHEAAGEFAHADDLHHDESEHAFVPAGHYDEHSDGLEHAGHDAHYQLDAHNQVDAHNQLDAHGEMQHEDLHHDDLHHDVLHHDDHAHDLIAPVATPASKAAAKKARRRRRLVALLITLGVFVAAIAIGAQFLKPLLGMDKVTDFPGPGTGSVTITVPEGSGPKAVANELVANRVVADSDSFVKEFLTEGAELSPGSFTFRTEMKNSDAVAVLVNKDASKVMYFALSAGLRINESLDAISKGSGISIQELNALNQAPGQFGVPAKAKNLEGFLAPGEYRFELGTSAKDIIQKLVTTTLDELKSQGVTDPAKQYDTVTIASIVQAEGGQADYGNVAGAIYNRLKPNNVETSGLIQSDATVTYGLGKKSFHLTEEEKADKSNPYNTYANVGLPVGPIGSPGKTAIDAAAKPTQNDYLYWVTINLDTKETKFSKTLAEHNTYVEQYNAWCQANAGRCV